MYIHSLFAGLSVRREQRQRHTLLCRRVSYPDRKSPYNGNLTSARGAPAAGRPNQILLAQHSCYVQYKLSQRREICTGINMAHLLGSVRLICSLCCLYLLSATANCEFGWFSSFVSRFCFVFAASFLGHVYLSRACLLARASRKELYSTSLVIQRGMMMCFTCSRTVHVDPDLHLLLSVCSCVCVQGVHSPFCSTWNGRPLSPFCCFCKFAVV